MEKKIFDTEFVYFIWDDKLKDKKGFVSDSIGSLKRCVEKCAYGPKLYVEDSKNGEFPFLAPSLNSSFRFFYYDPLCDIKWAWKQGKRIQCRAPSGAWMDTSNPNWGTKSIEFRIKPEARRMTYRELAEWLSKGNGQYRTCPEVTMAFPFFTYAAEDTTEISADYLVRRWGSNEWISPTVDVYEQDCKKED